LLCELKLQTIPSYVAHLVDVPDDILESLREFT